MSQKLYIFGDSFSAGFSFESNWTNNYVNWKGYTPDTFGDIISNKKTFLLIKALELAKGKDKEELQYWLDLIHFDKGEKVDAVTSIYDKLGIRFLTEKKMQSYFDKGLKQLEELHIKDNSYYTALITVTQELINREK